MVQRGTVVTVADNTGGKFAAIIGIYGGSRHRFAYLGDTVKVSIVKALPNRAIEEHSVHKAVVVRVTKEHRREDGSYIRFDDNAVVILDTDDVSPKGTRIFGPVAREVKNKNFNKIISLAPEVL